ncbi:hypothetical protein HPB51_029356 [Rhipicephalus microplus]|uniref:Uncharacterized protein n=1 Tax=Rhipicephalus microplus TaxID=6941 RepID=A0A9J6CV04_RHIMP|nr:hypothetical protein HPB51_029356 [Rhipicephalus microplus]
MATAAVETQKSTTLSSDEHEPRELVIHEHAPTPPGFPEHTQQKTISMLACVGRGRNSRSRNPDADNGGTLSKSLRPSSLGAHKADAGPPECSARKVRRDTAGRPRGCTSGSEHEHAPSKHTDGKPVADDVDTDSGFFFNLWVLCMPSRGHAFPRPATLITVVLRGAEG